jgi:excisionase family DNA binding protein
VVPITIGDLKVYNVEEVAKLLQLQEKTVRRYLKEGRFHGRKVGNRWYISEDQLSGYFRDLASDAEVDRINEQLSKAEKDIDDFLKRLRSHLIGIQRELQDRGLEDGHTRMLDDVELASYAGLLCLNEVAENTAFLDYAGPRFRRPFSMEEFSEEMSKVFKAPARTVSPEVREQDAHNRAFAEALIDKFKLRQKSRDDGQAEEVEEP